MNISNHLEERATREQTAWDQGDVWAENRRMIERFPHVFNCQNFKRISTETHARFREAIANRNILEIGCHTGATAKTLLHCNLKSYIGIDISPLAIETAKRDTGMETFYVMNGESLKFEDEAFDVVFGSAILHHLDWEKALFEIKRVLKPGGKAFFNEPLGDNPLSKLYRKLTPQARTEDECPVTRRQLRWADRLFSKNYHHFTSFFSMYAGAASSHLFKSENNLLLRLCDSLDRQIEKTPIKYWMRYVFIEWKK